MIRYDDISADQQVAFVLTELRQRVQAAGIAEDPTTARTLRLTFEAASSSTNPVIVYRYGSARAPSGMVLNPVAEELAGATLLRPELLRETLMTFADARGA